MRMLVVTGYVASSLSIIPWSAAADLLRYWQGRIPVPLQELLIAIGGGIVRLLFGR